MSEPKKRIRKRAIAIQIQQCLDDAARATTADISTQKLIQARLKTLTTMQARERNDKLNRALAEVARLTAENTRLKQESRESTEPLPLDKVAAALLNAKREGL